MFKHTTHFKGCGCPHALTNGEGVALFEHLRERYGRFMVTSSAGGCPHCGNELHGIVTQQDKKTGECLIPGGYGNEWTLYECIGCGAVHTLYDCHPGSWRESSFALAT